MPRTFSSSGGRSRGLRLLKETGFLPAGSLSGERGGKALIPPVDGGSALLEIVNVEAKDQSLVLSFADSPAPLQGTVNVRAGGRDLGAFPLRNPLEVPLPLSTLPLGEVQVRLTFHAPQVALKAAVVRGAAEGRDVRAVGSNVFQSGPSIADLVRPVTGGEVLVGTFVPPESPQSGQSFELTVEREDGRVVQSFSWRPRFWRRGRQRIALPLGGGEGFVRFACGRWRGARGTLEGLGFVGGRLAVKPAETAALPKKEPPRLVVVYVMDALRADRLDCLGARLGASITCDRLAREECCSALIAAWLQTLCPRPRSCSRATRSWSAAAGSSRPRTVRPSPSSSAPRAITPVFLGESAHQRGVWHGSGLRARGSRGAHRQLCERRL